MEILEAKENDFEEVNKILKQVHLIHVDFQPDKFKDVENVIEFEEFKELVSNKKIIVAKEKNKVIAFARIDIQERNIHSMQFQRRFIIDAFGVDEKFRNKGIGRKMLEFLKEKAKLLECTNLYLSANVRNIKAIKFYEDFGFVPNNITFSLNI